MATDMELAELADGLMQWPQTRGLIASRLGPTALAVSEEQAPALRERLREAGLPSQEPLATDKDNNTLATD